MVPVALELDKIVIITLEYMLPRFLPQILPAFSPVF
jgi:hypothetical protein